MKSTRALLCLLLAAPLCSYAADQIIPAGSLISCTVSEPKVNSKTTAIGDPILCRVGHAERYGRSVLPYDSYLVGRFEDYRDPGHFVGKGWMELRFDRMVIEPDTIIPVDARVVDVPGYNVDRYGRVLGKGHAVRDTVTWMIPVLWPIDLINLPRRGPRPTLKEETRMTLKVMDDMEIPQINQQPYEQAPSGLLRRPTSYDYQQAPPPPAPEPIAEQAPPPQVVVTPPPVYAMMAPPPVYYYPARPPRSVMVMRNGYAYRVWVR
ncbi:MAG TPA: hypothetical protein VHX60_05710 [Acidobacteriaceae bacterium]|jgi:hypothetical protein|nr:hypothetical protein [Acidobacteriaceae bacterium]